MAPRSASLARKALFSLATSVLLLAAVELLLRLTTQGLGHASIPAETVAAHVETEALDYDPVYGWVRHTLPDPMFHLDANGFRHLEALERQKAPEAWRGFTLGDSQTYGAGVGAGQTYTAFAEAALRAQAPARQVELINTGLSGYGSLQALRLIQHKLPDWAPDLFVVDCFAFDQPRDGLTPRGRLNALEQALFHYRTYYVLRFVAERALGRVRPMGVPTPDGERLRGAGNHDVIMQVAADLGVPVVFLDYPFWEGREGDRPEAIHCLAPATELPEGAIVIPVCQALRDRGGLPSTWFLDNNHLTAEGNRVVGEALARGLVERGLGP